jgi:ribonucleoside-triphosphate reductase
MEEELASIIVIKRDGKRVNFDGTKIAIAIKKGFDSIEGKYNEDDVNKVYNKVISKIAESKAEKIKIEEIQDLIEEELKENGYEDVYKSFSDYREKRNQSRELFLDEKRKHKFLKALEKLGLTTKLNLENTENENTIDEKMLSYGKTVSEEFTTSYLMKKKFSTEHENGDIFINKIEFYPMGATESCQIDLEKLYADGFKAGNSSMREPQSISSYTMLAIIAIASNQKDQDGEESIPNFDYYMAEGVLKTFKKEFRQTIYDILEYTDYDKFIALNGIDREIDKLSTIDFNIEQFYKFTRDSEELKRMFRIVYQNALKKTNTQVYQAMEAFVHDLNSICTNRVTSINLGTDTSKEGRMVTKNLLKIIEKGIGENEIPVSPKVVFKVKSGVNFNKKDKNYDLLEKACEIAVKTNNINFSFLDADFNEEKYKEGDFNTEVAYFSNGDRVIDNILDKEKAVSVSRGIISSTVINLPRIGLKNKNNLDGFFNELDEKLETVKDQLMERFEIQATKKAFNFPFLVGQNVWIDSEKIKVEDRMRRALKQGAMQISFVGLYESIVALTGKDYADSKDGRELALKIVNTMRNKVDEFSKKNNLTFVLAGDTDKEVEKAFLEFDRVIFGKVKGVTDKERYTSSFEIPANEGIEKKIKAEADFHSITNGGHMLKIEKKDIKNFNKEKMLELIKEMEKSNIGFAQVY